LKCALDKTEWKTKNRQSKDTGNIFFRQDTGRRQTKQKKNTSQHRKV